MLERCRTWINFSTFLARLLGSGTLLEDTGVNWAVHDINLGLTPSNDRGKNVSQIVSDCRAIVATEYILLAGPIIFDRTKSDGSQSSQIASNDLFRTWANKLAELAQDSRSDSPWSLKSEAQKATAMMEELMSDASGRAK